MDSEYENSICYGFFVVSGQNSCCDHQRKFLWINTVSLGTTAVRKTYPGEYLEVFDSTEKIGHENMKAKDIGQKVRKILEQQSSYSDSN